MTRIYLAGALAAAGVLFVLWYGWSAKRDGIEQERAATERRGIDARNSADDADSALLRCIRGNGVFDFRTGKCG